MLCFRTHLIQARDEVGPDARALSGGAAGSVVPAHRRYEAGHQCSSVVTQREAAVLRAQQLLHALNLQCPLNAVPQAKRLSV